MPLYEYLCRGCGLPFERYVRAWGDPVDCPACGGASVEKKVSSFAFTGAGGGCGCGRGACGCHH